MMGANILNAIVSNEILRNISLLLFYGLLVVPWYWVLRRKAVRSKINFMQLLHSVLYPASAIMVVGLVGGSSMALAARYLPLSYDYSGITSPMGELVKMSCMDPWSYICRTTLIQQQYPTLGWSYLIFNYLILAWMIGVVAIIVKSKTAISKRRTILSFVAAFLILTVGAGIVGALFVLRVGDPLST